MEIMHVCSKTKLEVTQNEKTFSIKNKVSGE